jgi:hypothetical protein
VRGFELSGLCGGSRILDSSRPMKRM